MASIVKKLTNRSPEWLYLIASSWLFFQILLYFSTGLERLKLFTESFRQHNFKGRERFLASVFFENHREKKETLREKTWQMSCFRGKNSARARLNFGLIFRSHILLFSHFQRISDFEYFVRAKQRQTHRRASYVINN